MIVMRSENLSYFKFFENEDTLFTPMKTSLDLLRFLPILEVFLTV